jgi:hypothetical protein
LKGFCNCDFLTLACMITILSNLLRTHGAYREIYFSSLFSLMFSGDQYRETSEFQ